MTLRGRDESGQALVLTVIFLSLIIGATGLAIDVGSWYRESRQAQTTADAAALSGAEQLQGGTAAAQSSAQSYATQNGGGVAPGGITFQSAYVPNHIDTISVTVTRTAPGFFSKVFGVDSVQVHAHASARSAVPVDVLGAAPIVVKSDHPMLTGSGCGNTNPPAPCFGATNETVLPLGKNGAPGAFGIVDLLKFTQSDTSNPTDPCDNAGQGGGNAGSSVVGGWITSGFSDYLNLGCYASDPGAKFNSANVEDALSAKLGSVLLFPIYDLESNANGGGANVQYHVIGWAAYYVTGWRSNGSSANLPGYTCASTGVCGYFTQVNWAGQASSSAPTNPDYGVHTIALVN